MGIDDNDLANVGVVLYDPVMLYVWITILGEMMV